MPDLKTNIRRADIVDTATLFTTRRTDFDGFKIQPVMERFWDVISPYSPRPIQAMGGKDITDLQEIRRPMMQGSIMALSMDKMEKIVIGYWSIMKRLSVIFIIAYPQDGYDFPVLGSDIMEKKDKATLILDLHPLADIVLEAAYREQYLDGLDPVWNKYLGLSKDHNPNAWYRSMQSPFMVTSRMNMTVDDRSPAARQLDCLTEYMDYYFKRVVVPAQPAGEKAARTAQVKKQAIKDLYRAKDPGLGPMMMALGPFAVKRVAGVIY
jgi:hypothetical protein